MKKLSSTQVQMLTNVRDGLSYNDHCRGMSEYGGADGTLRSLVRHELLAWADNHTLMITALGRATLAEIEALKTARLQLVNQKSRRRSVKIVARRDRLRRNS